MWGAFGKLKVVFFIAGMIFTFGLGLRSVIAHSQSESFNINDEEKIYAELYIGIGQIIGLVFFWY